MIAKANPEVPNMDGPLLLDAAAVRAAMAAASGQDVAAASCVGAYITILWPSSPCSVCIVGYKISLT
jgi:hypothetical protein